MGDEKPGPKFHLGDWVKTEYGVDGSVCEVVRSPDGQYWYEVEVRFSAVGDALEFSEAHVYAADVYRKTHPDLL